MTIEEKRYKDLQEYFSNKDCAKAILENDDEFKKWLERLKWHIKKCDELAMELQAHRYAWAKLREDIRDEAEFAYADFDEYKYEVLGIDDVDDLPYDDYRYGMERVLELIEVYRPKEGDGNVKE